jgi:hypothetical protein
MGYWGYEATESDSALDYMSKVIAHLETLWNEADGYGEKMAVVYILTEAPAVDGSDYKGLKEKAVAFVEDCGDELNKEALENDVEAFNKRCAQITYLQGLIEKLRAKQGSTLIEKLKEDYEEHTDWTQTV